MAEFVEVSVDSTVDLADMLDLAGMKPSQFTFSMFFSDAKTYGNDTEIRVVINETVASLGELGYAIKYKLKQHRFGVSYFFVVESDAGRRKGMEHPKVVFGARTSAFAFISPILQALSFDGYDLVSQSSFDSFFVSGDHSRAKMPGMKYTLRKNPEPAELVRVGQHQSNLDGLESK